MSDIKDILVDLFHGNVRAAEELAENTCCNNAFSFADTKNKRKRRRINCNSMLYSVGRIRQEELICLDF